MNILSAAKDLSRRIPLLAAILAALILIGSNSRADAHADLLRADPTPDALLAAPPRTLDLWLTEPVAEGDGSPSIRLLDQSGNELPITNLNVDPDDPTHIRASVRGVGTGTFTVVWSNRSATDGHTISGSYAFRVASSTRAPGAATTEGDDPPPGPSLPAGSPSSAPPSSPAVSRSANLSSHPPNPIPPAAVADSPSWSVRVSPFSPPWPN